MISVAEAHEKIAALISPVGCETIGLARAGGRVLRKTAVATRDQPPFAASAMDGYAIRKSDLTPGTELKVIGEIAAGHSADLEVNAGQAVRIFTGGAIPAGADYVLIQEDADRTGDTIKVSENHDTKAYIRPAGGDFATGFKMPAPRRLSPSDVALLASMNQPKIEVSRHPIVALIATGDELVWPGQTPRPDQIMASNSFGIKAMLEAEGAEIRLMPIAPDTRDGLRRTLDLAADADLIVTLGGASVGDHDLVQDVAKEAGLDLAFYKLAMRPGKPLMAGKINNTPMIGLPGNPVSSMVCAKIFVVPAVRALQSLPHMGDPELTATLATQLGPNGPRAHYMRASVTATDGIWTCTPYERQDSSLLGVLSQANALMIRPAEDPALEIGAQVKFIHL